MSVAKAVLLTFLYLVLEMALQLFSYLIFDIRSNPKNMDHILGWTIIIPRVIAYLTIFYFFWKPNPRRLSLNSEKLRLSVILFIFLIVISTEFLNRPFADLDRLFENMPANFMYTGYTTYQLYGLFTALLVAPIFEELFFRKFLFQKLMLKNGFLTGLLVSSILFSIIHWETPLNLIPAFLMGLISAFIFYKTTNIFYCILLHFLYNFSNQIIYYKAELYSEWLNWLDFGILYWSLFIFGIIITLFAVRQIPSEAKKN